MHDPQTVRILRIAAKVERAPIAIPVRTSFGMMTDRPVVTVRAEDDEGRYGYGEIWCNFPSVGAEHRGRLAEMVVGPLLTELGEIRVEDVFRILMEHLHVLAIQSGEWGPLRQVAAGIDAACHDLAARRAGLPLWRFLDAGGKDRVRVYASGIGPETPGDAARTAARNGHTAFKVKLGFGDEADHQTLDAIRSSIGREAMLMGDANQAWDVERAVGRVRAMAQYNLTWLEEPIHADRPLSEWETLADASPIPLAGGENLSTLCDFHRMMERRTLRYIQPDLAKWGGVSGCMEVARAARSAGLVYCPHFLGGAVGLMCSAHVLAAAGAEGLLEMDVNPNSLRDRILSDALRLKDGELRLSESPGIGIDI